MPVIFVPIPEKMHEELWKIRNETGVSISFFVRKAVEAELIRSRKVERLRELRRKHAKN